MKILVLQLKRIGDLLLTTPTLRCLREAYPEAHITLAVDASCQGLLKGISADTYWVQHKQAGWSGWWGAGPNAWMGKELRSFSGDYCLDLTGTDRSAWLTLASSCRKRITYTRFRKKFARRFLYTDFVDSPVRERHTADHHTDILRPLGIDRQGVPLDLHVPDAADAKAQALLDESGIRGPFAVIHAGTARAEKYWRPESWAAVMDTLQQEQGLELVLTGSSDADEQAHLQAIKSELRGTCVDLSGRTKLLELAAVIFRARLFCGVDTAAMHLAEAMKTPSVALFGPTNPFHWRPRQTRSIVLRADTREPFTPGQKGGAMAHISVEAVLEAVQELNAAAKDRAKPERPGFQP